MPLKGGILVVIVRTFTAVRGYFFDGKAVTSLVAKIKHFVFFS
jgi:hypothetical protein